MKFHRANKPLTYLQRRTLASSRLLALIGFSGLFLMIILGGGPLLLTPAGLPPLIILGGSLVVGLFFIFLYGGPTALTTQALLTGGAFVLVGLVGLSASLWQSLIQTYEPLHLVNAAFVEMARVRGSFLIGPLLLLGSGVALVMLGAATRLLLVPERAEQ